MVSKKKKSKKKWNNFFVWFFHIFLSVEKSWDGWCVSALKVSFRVLFFFFVLFSATGRCLGRDFYDPLALPLAIWSAGIGFRCFFFFFFSFSSFFFFFALCYLIFLILFLFFFFVHLLFFLSLFISVLFCPPPPPLLFTLCSFIGTLSLLCYVFFFFYRVYR